MDLSYFDQYINQTEDAREKTKQTPCAPPPSPEIKFKEDKAFAPSIIILNKHVEKMKWEEKHVRYMEERNDIYCKLDSVKTKIVVNMVINQLKCLEINC